jgi:hypothetical protein
MTSVYEIVTNGGNGSPSAKKIKLFGQSVFAAEQTIGGGDMANIGNAICFYTPTTGDRGIENNRTLGCNTSDIVALFTKKKSAIVCSNQRDLKKYDERWVKDTEHVLKKIGRDHPNFTVSDRKKWSY